MRKKNKADRQALKILWFVCLSFLLGTMGGALIANVLSQGGQGEISLFLEEATEQAEVPTFWSIFWKYFKYDLIIFLGGWMQMGFFFSGAAFLFRSISVGFTSAVLMLVHGSRGIWLAVSSFLPQNFLLIPAYILMMSAALYYMLHWREEGGKRTLKREKRRKQTEYCIIFGITVVLLSVAAGTERFFILG